MEFALSEEQQTLQEVVRDILAAKSPEAAVRAQSDSPVGFDTVLWKQMADQLGLQSIAIPEKFGGSGFGFVELGVVLEELGRALTVSPFLASCVMAPELLLGLGDEAACKAYLPAIASGELIATVAIAEDGGSWRPGDVSVTATADGDAWRIAGAKSFVLDGASADVVFVIARTDDGLGVFAVEADAPGLDRQPLETWDQTRKQARLTFDGVLATRIGTAESAEPAVNRMLDHTAIAVAAECVGGAARVLDMSVEYAKVREQFGRPIGSFQAIKHKCASMLVDLEAARSAALYATWAASVEHEDVPRVASLAKAFCADAYLTAALENIQIHGGIGFTWEHPAHLYLKRAKNDQTFLGGSDLHRQLLADRLGI
jgi:alkylation response protein AidB-like acyl-CoA dehydrogenase